MRASSVIVTSAWALTAVLGASAVRADGECRKGHRGAERGAAAGGEPRSDDTDASRFARTFEAIDFNLLAKLVTP